jgi:hypothetical protein
MIGVGISAGLTGAKRARSIQDPLPALDLDWATDRSLPAAYGPTPSFSRASTGTLTNSSGVLTTAAINAPRFNHVYNGSSWVSKGLLVEEARTNSFFYSEDFSNAYWTKSASTVSSNVTLAPDGTNTADKIEETTSNAAHQAYSIFSASATTYTFSVYGKSSERNLLQVDFNGSVNYAIFNLTSGTVTASSGSGLTASITSVGNGWFRCAITQSQSSGTIYPAFRPVLTGTTTIYAGTTGYGLFMWGAQIESGSFPTSYIPTTTAQATRSADVCQITGTDFSGFWNEPAGTLVAEGDTPASGTRSLVSADNATANESSVLRAVGTDPLFVVTDGGVAQASIDAGTVVSGSAFKLAAAYTANDFAVSKDGAAVVTDTSGTIPTPTRINIGTDAAGNYLCGHISRLRYYPTRLTNAKLQELST